MYNYYNETDTPTNSIEDMPKKLSIDENKDSYINQIFSTFTDEEIKNLDNARNEKLKDPYKNIRKEHRLDIN